jgi:hypothetical protein
MAKFSRISVGRVDTAKLALVAEAIKAVEL